MKIIDISPEHENTYFCCLEDWSDEMKEAGDHKQRWYGRMKDKGVRVKLAQDDDGVIGGMIQYMPLYLKVKTCLRFFVSGCMDIRRVLVIIRKKVWGRPS
jgi:hypothetical protein